MAPLFDAARPGVRRCSSRERVRARRFRCSRRSSPTDPHNLDAALRLATAHSVARPRRAGARRRSSRRRGDRARLARRADLPRAALRARQGVAARRAAARAGRRRGARTALPALEALAVDPRTAGRLAERRRCGSRSTRCARRRAAELVAARAAGDGARTDAAAIDAFERRARCRARVPPRSRARRAVPGRAALPEARDALDRVPPSHPGYPMALFKRAQVSVLLNEPDRAARIARGARARRRDDAAADRARAAVSVMTTNRTGSS